MAQQYSGSLSENQLLGMRLRDCLFTDSGQGIAVLLRGPWGAGKTWLWDNEIAPRAEKRPTIYLSLFGAASIEDLGRRVLAASLLQLDQGGSSSKRLKAAMKRLASLGKKVLETKTGIEFALSIFEPIDVVPEGAVVCIDDLERVNKELGLETVLGIVDHLTLYRGCRVLVLANTDAIEGDQSKQWPSLAEKTFSMTMTLGVGTAVAQQVIRNSAPHLSEADREALARVHERCRCSNLRQLRRVASTMSDVRNRVERDLGEDAASFLYLVIENIQRESSPEFYHRLSGPSHLLGAAKDPNAKERAELVWRFFGVGRSFTFSPSLFALVRDGIVGTSLESEFRTLDNLTDPAEQVLARATHGGRLIFWTEPMLAQWCVDATAVISNKLISSLHVLFGFAAYLALADELLGTKHFAANLAEFRQQAVCLATSSCRPGYHFNLPHDQAAKEAFEPLMREADEVAEQDSLSSLRARLFQAIECGNHLELEDCLDQRLASAAILEPTAITTLLSKFDRHRRSVAVVVSHALRRTGNREMKMRLYDELNKVQTDLVGQVLIAELRNAAKREFESTEYHAT